MAFNSFLQSSRSPEQRLKDAIQSNNHTELQTLLKTGIDPNLKLQRHGGNTALHFAASSGCCQMVETLLEAGADPNVKNDHGNQPLVYACQKSEYDVFLKLLPITNCGDFTFIPLIQGVVDDYGAWDQISPRVKRLMFKASPSVQIYCHHFDILLQDKCWETLIMCGKNIYDSDIKDELQRIVNHYEIFLSVMNSSINQHAGLHINMDGLDQAKDFLVFMNNIRINTQSLQHLCRLKIRKSFIGRCNVFYGVNRLSLPKVLKEYICFV